MDERILILVYPGLGKTYTAEHFGNVSDFEQQHYMFIYDDDIKDLPLEQIKSDASRRKPNPDWPNNFVEAIDRELGRSEIVITTFIPKVYDALVNNAKYENTRIVLVVFDEDNFNELADRFRARGNTEEFVERRRLDFPRVIEQFNDAQNVEKIIINGGGYLSDALIAHGVNLRPGKGSKNYL